MCETCRTFFKSFDLCQECGKEICPICVSCTNRRIHAKCLEQKRLDRAPVIYGISPVLEEHMCNYCGSNGRRYGFCVNCGKEICENCKSPISKFYHEKCRPNVLIGNGGTTGKISTAGEPIGIAESVREPCGGSL